MGASESQLTFGWGALTVIALYLSSTIGVGWLARRSSRGHSLSDHYLAGRSLGFLALFLTLYSTQYSGNTLFGYTGISYRIGFSWTASILFMFSVITGYLLFAPRLVALSRKKKFITPGDYIAHRFGSPRLTLLATLLMIYALANYTLAQLRAIGAAVEGLTNGAVPSAYGIITLAIIMVVYETLGGMRSVAWTDMIQGILLLSGFLMLLFMVPGLAGGLPAVVEHLSRIDPAKVEVPTLEGCMNWISYVFLFGFGAAIYPQAIQRLYASRSTRVLKRSLALMTIMPFTTALIAMICGVTGSMVLPDLALGETDQVLARICSLIMNQSTEGYWLVVLIFAAALAALMSTADSALLSISSMVTKDIYQVYFRPQRGRTDLRRQVVLLDHRHPAGDHCHRDREHADPPPRAQVRGAHPDSSLLFPGPLLEAAPRRDRAYRNGGGLAGRPGTDLAGLSSAMGIPCRRHRPAGEFRLLPGGCPASDLTETDMNGYSCTKL